MKKRLLLLAAIVCVAVSGMAQKVPAKLTNGAVINLYDKVEKSTVEEKSIELNGTDIVVNVTNPTMTVYLPEEGKTNGTTMLVCPGGGFCMLSWTTEGTMVAEELAKRGTTVFLLKYRLNPLLNEDGTGVSTQGDVLKGIMAVTQKAIEKTGALKEGRQPLMAEIAGNTDCTPLAMEDAIQAMTLIKANATKWGLDSEKVGIMGFSAGSMMTMHVAMNHTAASRPAFAAPIYSGWTKDVTVPQDAAPLFVCSPVKDVFTPEEQMNIYLAWRNAEKPVELHNFSQTVHGFGAVKSGKAVDSWIDLMFNFMKDVEFIKK